MAQSGNRIDEEASAWVVRQAAGPLSPEEQDALNAWLAADTRHKGALLRAEAVWEELDRFAALSRGARPLTPPPARAHRFRLATWPVRIAAALLLFAIGVGGWYAIQQVREPTYVTRVGEAREVKLADGSTLALNTNSKAIVRFSETAREVHLTRGEALFEVAKDPSRPFIVHVGNLAVRAVGTAFTVRRNGEQVDVTVTEGVVEVIRKDEPDTQAAVQRLRAHQRAVVEPAKVHVERIEPDEAERSLAWRNGMVAFDGELLAEAVQEMNRHSRRRLVIDDASLAGRPVVGIFNAHDIEAFAAASAIAFDAEVVHEGDTLRLRSKSRSQEKN
jgi:transmembrane sensor